MPLVKQLPLFTATWEKKILPSGGTAQSLSVVLTLLVLSVLTVLVLLILLALLILSVLALVILVVLIRHFNFLLWSVAP